MTIFFYCVLALFVLLCAISCLIVLIQESKSMGLGASFGGDSGDSLFGTSTAAVLKTITAWLAVVFVVSCIALSLWTAAIGRAAGVYRPGTEWSP